MNIGNRQAGRLKAPSVVDCDDDYDSIFSAVEKVFDTNFVQDLGEFNNPYGNGGSSEKLLDILRSPEVSTGFGKSFFDIPFDLS